MDTSIIAVIAIIVVFAVVVPTMIRRSATELSRVEIDTVPHQAQIIAADPHIPGHDHTERAKVFQSVVTAEPAVPRPDVAPMTRAPKLSLSAPTPEFAVIDGHADTRLTTDTSTSAEAEEQHQRNILPLAVGETRSAYHEDLSHAAHEAIMTGATGNVRMLHPAVRSVFNQSHGGSSGSRGESTRQSPTGRGSRGGDHLGERSKTIPIRPGAAQTGSPSNRSVRAAIGSTADTTRRGTQIPNPTFGADEDHSMTEKATTLRESMKSLGTMTRGFALLFLASALGILVTGVLAMFSVVHVALTGVFLGLAIVSLVIVRTLNLRKREIKSRLRELERPSCKAKGAAPKPKVAPKTVTTKPAGRTKPAAATKPATATKSSEAQSAGSTKAAQARAVMQRNVSAKQTREEADTGEVPIVRIRNEAAEGHTTRQVLLTGPIPVVEEASSETTEADTAETTPAVETTPAMESTPAMSSASEADNAPAAESAPTTRSSDDTDVEVVASEVDSGNVSDPFMQRLQARDGWLPTPLPVPSYVGAAQVEHPVPEAKAADVSSYETQARSREDIAAQFAAELGYRPELSDSARDDSPLEHGRKATRTTNKAPELNVLEDVLARRRA